MSVYLAPEVDKIVEELAPNLNINIISVFEDKKKSQWLAKVSKAGAILNLLTKAEVILHVWDDGWAGLDDNQKHAVVYHELCHIDVSINKKGERIIKLLPHPVEEFPEVVKNYGLWNAPLRRMGDIVERVLAEDSK